MLLALLTTAPIEAASQDGADVQQGKKLFEDMCARCHGIDGTGDEGPSLNRPTLTRAGTDETLAGGDSGRHPGSRNASAGYAVFAFGLR
jgi:mono/diheme cytochrome c family protein